jgi:hypothetical protein
MSRDGVSHIQELFDISFKHGRGMINNDNIRMAHQMLPMTSFTWALNSAATDIAVEIDPIDTNFLTEISKLAERFLGKIGSTFPYDPNRSELSASKLDKLKTAGWRMLEVCTRRLSEGNKRLFDTRTEASAGL